MCSPNFLAKSCVISISFFPVNTKSFAYANTFSCCFPIFIPLGTVFILRIIFCNAKLNNIGDGESPCFIHVLFSKNDDSVPSILTALLVFVHMFYTYLLFF